MPASIFDTINDHVTQLESKVNEDFSNLTSKLSEIGCPDFSYNQLRWDGGNLYRIKDGAKVSELDFRDRLYLHQFFEEFFLRASKYRFYTYTI